MSAIPALCTVVWTGMHGLVLTARPSLMPSLFVAVTHNCLLCATDIAVTKYNSPTILISKIALACCNHGMHSTYIRLQMLQVRAKTFYAEKKGLNVADVDVPVIGGHAGVTILPLFSQASPHAQLSDEETEQLTKRTQDGGTEVVTAKAGKVPTLFPLPAASTCL